MISWLINFWSWLLQTGWNGYPFHVFTSFSTVLLRRYLGWTAGEKPLLVRLWTVEAILMIFWSLWTVLLRTYTPSFVSFQFCYCLILFECENKCESVCMLLHWCSSVQTEESISKSNQSRSIITKSSYLLKWVLTSISYLFNRLCII